MHVKTPLAKILLPPDLAGATIPSTPTGTPPFLQLELPEVYLISTTTQSDIVTDNGQNIGFQLKIQHLPQMAICAKR